MSAFETPSDGDGIADATRYEPQTVDLSSRNAHSLAIELVGTGRKVLEVGTSTGYLSRVLKERGNVVTGIEVDEEAASRARRWCERVVTGDVERLPLEDIFRPGEFDVILFADVLEHLKWPHLVLRKLRPCLREDGCLVVSLPNIAHGDIILKLLMGRFSYTSMGLLDITHIRFFGLTDVVKLFDSAGYELRNLQEVIADVGTTEAGIDLRQVPAELLEALRQLPYAKTYQFVFQAFKKRPGAAELLVRESNLQAAFGGYRWAEQHAQLRTAWATAEADAQRWRRFQESSAWQLLRRYYRLRDSILPPNSKRRGATKYLTRLISGR